MPDPLLEAVVFNINDIAPLFGILNADILHEFLANLLHESIEFTHMEENLNYSAKRLMQVWPSRFRKIEDAEKYAGKPQLLANYVYGGRMGNEQPGDGWDFRGGGPIQLTGRGMYTAFARFMLNKHGLKKTAQEWAQLLRSKDLENMKWQIYSACWVFAVAKDLLDLAIDDNMKEIVRRINGGYNGIEDRMRYYELCKKYIPE